MSSAEQLGPLSVPGVMSAFADMGELSATSVSFGYYQENVAEAEIATAHNKLERRGRIGWWNRHRMLFTGVSVGLATNVAFLPLLQNATLLVLG